MSQSGQDHNEQHGDPGDDERPPPGCDPCAQQEHANEQQPGRVPIAEVLDPRHLPPTQADRNAARIICEWLEEETGFHWVAVARRPS